MRALVTGGAGFIGSNLVDALVERGDEVTAIDNLTTGRRENLAGALERGVRLVEADIRDAAAMRDVVGDARPEIVFHLAAQAIVRAALEDPAGTYAINVLGTGHLLDAARDAAVVCVTSDKCYAPGPEAHREGDPLGGLDPYSASKAAQEHVAAAHRAAYGARVATARAGNVIGGGDWGRDRLVPDLVRARESGAPVVLRHPEAVRPWQHMLDPLAGYLLLAERLHGSADWATAFNFGPDEAWPVSWVVDRVRERWPLEVRVEPPGDGVEAPALRLDSSAAREKLGWTPHFATGEAVAATVSWYEKVRAGGDARAVTLTQIEEAT